MTDFTTETISNFLYSKVDSIIIVDIQNSDYQAIKRTGVFEKIIAPNGNYHELIKKLWFHFNKSSNKISEDYQIFLPMLGKFSGKYSNKINFVLDDVIHIVQLSIYPLNEQNTKYMFLLDELDNSKYIRDFMAHKKVDTIHNTFLFSMYVDLLKDTTSSINVTEISNDPMHYDVSYSTWRETIVNMFLPEDQSLFLERTAPEYLKKNLLPGRTASFDCQMKNLKGIFIWVKLIFSRAETTNDDDFRFVFMVQNIHDDSIKLFDTLKKYEILASQDALTNIFNRGRIETEIENAIETLKMNNENISLMMLDIDYFKRVNDMFGHSVGDNVLKQFTKTIKDFFKAHNVKIGRWGGEEFVCICYESIFEQVKILAENLRKKIESTKFEQVGTLTCSIGVTKLKKDDTPLIVFNRADAAMYKAKNKGRNCVIYE